MESRSIEAVLKLSYGSFESDLNKVINLVEKLDVTLSSLGKSNASQGISFLDGIISNLVVDLQQLTKLSKEVQSFNLLASGVNKTANAMKLLDQVTSITDNDLSKLDSILEKVSQAVINTYDEIRKLGNEENTTSQKISDLITKFNNLLNIASQIETKFKGIDSTFNKTEKSIDELGNEVLESKNNFSQLNNQLTTTNTKLSSIDSSTKKTAKSVDLLGSAVRRTFSMYFYQGIEAIKRSVVETYKAKSEMQSWFDVMGMSSSQIDSFNRKLDETVAQFQRVNKYGMGETIASLGVEFELTGEQMEKAMSTTAMITNEYLRAGRSTEEANLAIKDILQGQFQRLSRETGVGKEDLVEAGWDEDITNVTGILDALNKIAKDRNWDEIAQKATSVNDILLIGQNRLSEWATDIIDRFTPTLVGSFNAFMDVMGYVQSTVEGVMDFLSGDSWVATAVKIGGIATAIYSVITAFVKFRTGASLVQITQMGLKDSIIATTLGLNGETVAMYGSSNAIKSRLTGLEAERVMELSLKDAILTKVLGLNAEKVAENGLAGALRESIIQRKVNEAVTKGEASAISLLKDEETGEIILKELYSKTTTKQSASTLGFSAALKMMIADEVIAEDVTLSLGGAIGILTAEMLMNPITWFIGALVALAGAFYVATGGLSDHWEKMKQFNETMDNSKDIVQQNNDYLKGLGETLGYDSQIYKDTANVVDAFNNKLNESEEVVKKYNEELSNIDIKLTTSFDESLKNNYGFDDNQLSKFREYGILDEGKSTYENALDVIYLQEANAKKTQKDILDMMDERYASDEDMADKSNQIKEHEANLIKHSAEHNTSEDWWGGTWAGFLAGIDSFQIWLDYATEDLATWFSDFNNEWSKLPEQLGEAWNNLKLPNLWKNLRDWWDDAGKSFSDSWSYLQGAWENNIAQPLREMWNNFFSFDWLDIDWNIWDILGFDSAFASDGSSGGEHDYLAEFFDDPRITGFFDGIKEWVDNFPDSLLDSFGIDLSGFSIGSLVSALFGGDDGSDPNDIDWVATFVDNNIIYPITTGIQNFLADPLGTLETGQLNIASFLDGIFGTDLEGMTLWVQDHVVNPLASGISNGIASIPIIGDIASMLGLVSSENQDAHDTGYNLIDYLKQGVEQKIGEIPIVGDIARMLGLIPQQNGNARNKGYGVGDNIKQGESEGHKGTADNVKTEMDNIVSAISKKVGEVYSTAYNIGSQILSGIQNALDMHSPSIISRELLPKEFGEYIPEAILSGSDAVYSSAMSYAENIKQGIVDSGTAEISMDGMVTDYQDDAQIISDSSQMMGITTTTAFNDMQLSVNDTTSQMANNVNTQYTVMQQKQASLLSNMKTSNTNAYNDLYQKTNSSLLQMRSSTENVTAQMTDAWKLMKKNIVTSANQLKTESIQHFDKLSSNIGSFYRKIQNPSNWGAGEPSSSRVVSRSPSSGRRLLSATKHGAGASPYRGQSASMSIDDLMRMVGISDSTKVDLNTFLQSIIGEHGYGWSDWHTKHYAHIKNTSDKWKTAPPMIMGRIKTGNGYFVGDFNTGQPSLGWNDFVETAGDLFSAIPYAFYYDSQKWGSWQNALEHGEANCSDGSDALIALASVFGFGGGSKVHTTTRSGIGHYYAIINGHKMDTTNFQQSGSWSPLGGAGAVRGSHGAGSTTNNKTINVIVDMSNSTIYGVDDLDNRIQEGVKKGLREEFNDPYTVVI